MLPGSSSMKLAPALLKESHRQVIGNGLKSASISLDVQRRGIAGRAAFNGHVATVFNGSGFIAQAVISRLGKIGTQIVVAYRGSGYKEEKLRISGDLGQMYYSQYHLKDDKSLYEAMCHSDIVINTIGNFHHTRNFSHEETHVEGPRRMAKIARECGVKKFIHLSALNASPNPTPICLKKPSKFLTSKYHGELAVREEFPEAIIFRPADVLGERDSFLNHFTEKARARFTRSLPIWDYYHEVQKQPVWVSDLVSGIERAILDSRWSGKTIQAVGPYRYDFEELIEFMRACGGQGEKHDDCRITNLRWDFIMRTAITALEKIQKFPITTWERIENDCHSDRVDPKLPTLADMGVELTPLEPRIQHLAYYRPRFHRVEIPYETSMIISQPRKLNMPSA